ncbi:MAG: stage II sporulation protein R [Oscillospiraceae bacterium]|nr:stage II sporulation protein R [Oscillospiraceae bacterium]
MSETKKQNPITKVLSKLKARDVAAIVGVITFALVNIFSFAAKCADIRQEVLRLHVIANSDSEFDQSMKLAVRDAVLTAGAEVFDGSVTAADAAEKISPQIETLTVAAKQVIQSYGCDYPVRIQIAEEYFDTRVYETVTLPAGKYNAVKVIIGEGGGKNWWCVMFPPLCLPAAEPAQTEDDIQMVFGDGGQKIVQSSSKYEIRFKIVELYEKIVNDISSRINK